MAQPTGYMDLDALTRGLSAAGVAPMHESASTHIASVERIPVHVEVKLKATSTATPSAIKPLFFSFLEKMAFFREGSVDFSSDDQLRHHVESALVTMPFEHIYSSLAFYRVQLFIHVYQLNEDGAAEEMADGDEKVVALHQWLLPAIEFDGLWKSLYFDTHIKEQLLQFASTAMLFSDKKVDNSIISCNRVVLLHGPPGTGKTSLCKALAQKLAIRFSDRYSTGLLLEINAHSLFSKWFSESGKLVMKLFEKIFELVEDKDCLVCVLIDEVESLTSARQSALSGSEPSDAIRVVNALLTQIDKLRIHENVLILCTSNLTQALDLAFVDRADIKQYIGLPNLHARYEILRSCINELIRVGIIESAQAGLQSFADLATDLGRSIEKMESLPLNDLPDRTPSVALLKIAGRCEGLSGRFLRKAPFQAHAFFVQTATVALPKYVQSLALAVQKELVARKDFPGSMQHS